MPSGVQTEAAPHRPFDRGRPWRALRPPGSSISGLPGFPRALTGRFPRALPAPEPEILCRRSLSSRIRPAARRADPKRSTATSTSGSSTAPSTARPRQFRAAGKWLNILQTGLVRDYALAFLLGAVVFLGVPPDVSRDDDLPTSQPDHVPSAGRGPPARLRPRRARPDGPPRGPRRVGRRSCPDPCPLVRVRRRDRRLRNSSNSGPGSATALDYHVGIDGISLFLVLLTAFLMPVALLSSWRVGRRPGQGILLLHARPRDRHHRRLRLPRTCSFSTSSGRPCSSPCTSSSGYGAGAGGSTPR